MKITALTTFVSKFIIFSLLVTSSKQRDCIWCSERAGHDETLVGVFWLNHLPCRTNTHSLALTNCSMLWKTWLMNVTDHSVCSRSLKPWTTNFRNTENEPHGSVTRQRNSQKRQHLKQDDLESNTFQGKNTFVQTRHSYGWITRAVQQILLKCLCVAVPQIHHVLKHVECKLSKNNVCSVLALQYCPQQYVKIWDIHLQTQSFFMKENVCTNPPPRKVSCRAWAFSTPELWSHGKK